MNPLLAVCEWLCAAPSSSHPNRNLHVQTSPQLVQLIRQVIATADPPGVTLTETNIIKPGFVPPSPTLLLSTEPACFVHGRVGNHRSFKTDFCSIILTDHSPDQPVSRQLRASLQWHLLSRLKHWSTETSAAADLFMDRFTFRYTFRKNRTSPENMADIGTMFSKFVAETAPENILDPFELWETFVETHSEPVQEIINEVSHLVRNKLLSHAQKFHREHPPPKEVSSF